MKITDKLKLIRKTNNLTQAEFAASIGISRGNLANIEIGKVAPTPVFINCVCLMYNVEKSWLVDDSNNDLSGLNNSANVLSMIVEKYEQLEVPYQKFVEHQILELLEIQKLYETQKK